MWKNYPICFVCHKLIQDYSECSLEHVVPKSLGGTNQPRNLSISHRNCNSHRKNICCPLLRENQMLIPSIAKPRKLLTATSEQMVEAWKEKHQRIEEELFNLFQQVST